MTVANLTASLHRAIEPESTYNELRKVFPHCDVNHPLRGGAAVRDEGAANHMRLGDSTNSPGIHVFVYGDAQPMPAIHWPRQTKLLCETMIRKHGLHCVNAFVLKQHPEAIDAGAFHNDVVATSHHNLLIHHEKAFYDAATTLAKVATRYGQMFDLEFQHIVITNDELPLSEAVSTYLFNSQIILPSNESSSRPVILCPTQVRENENAKRIVARWIDKGVFAEAHYVELRESMAGGGGPACLRLRVPMTEGEIEGISPSYLWTKDLDEKLRRVIDAHYPQELRIENLGDAAFVEHAHNTHRLIDRIFDSTQL